MPSFIDVAQKNDATAYKHGNTYEDKDIILYISLTFLLYKCVGWI